MRPTFLARISLGALALSFAGCEGVAGDLGVKAAEAPPQQQTPPSVAGKPVITTFNCTPESGPASLSSACSIGVAHPDQTPVKCTLTVNDGRAPVVDAACTSPTMVAFEKAGTYVLTLIVLDELGQIVQKALTVT